MIPERIGQYLDDVQRLLIARGIRNTRFVDEVREHLVDAVDSGLRHGLSLDAAEELALARFGPAEFVAAGCEDEKALMTQGIYGRLRRALDGVWRLKWWMLVPAALVALVTALGSYYFLPPRYRSAGGIMITEVPASFADTQAAAGNRMAGRVERMSARILSPSQLERIITDLDLYPRERQTMSIDDVAARMRGDIAIDLFAPNVLQGEAAGFRVSFVSSTPRVAMKVTERLASLFIEENLRGREQQMNMVSSAMDARIDRMKRDIVQYETDLARLRARSGGNPLSQADLIPYEVMKDAYRALLVERLESKFPRGGEQFQIIEPPHLPERPLGPTRAHVNTAGAVAGLAVGVILMSAAAIRQSS
jgi:uncharacterized protein involved in exopolysaccharide biosynthesis